MASKHWRKAAADLIFGDYGDQPVYGDLETYGIIWRLSGKTLAWQDEFGFRDVTRYRSEKEAEDICEEYIGAFRIWQHGSCILEGENIEDIKSGKYVREGVTLINEGGCDV